MSNSQTLQLYLDLTQTQGAQDGLFAANATGHASKVWVNQAGAQTPDSVLTVNLTDQAAIGMQVTINLPLNWSFYGSGHQGDCLRITAVFGRNHKQTSNAVYDSPFTINNLAPANGGQVCTVFDQWFSVTTVTSGGGSITLPFGTPQLSSGVANGKDKYAFIVAITLNVMDNTTSPGTQKTFTAGHDPEMDVDC